MTTDMHGKVVVITGATSGIGQVTAEALATMGARIVQVARDRGRGEEAMRRLGQRAPGIAHAIHYADLSRISEMKRVASDIALAEQRIDVLINNAGALFGTRQLTEDGLEMTFALNHMSYFVMARGLRDRLVASAPARIVNTASGAHRGATLDFADLQSEKAYGAVGEGWLMHGGPGFRVYARSKLCNILFTRALARRLTGTQVTANCFHPGLVNSRFGDHSGGFLSTAVRLAKHFALTPEQGAQTQVYLASSPQVASVTGDYFIKCRPATPSRAAQDDAAAERLWAMTAELAHLPA